VTNLDKANTVSTKMVSQQTMLFFEHHYCHVDEKRPLSLTPQSLPSLVKQVGILNSFDTRLASLESSVLPIHKSTQSLTRLAGSKSGMMHHLTVKDQLLCNTVHSQPVFVPN